MSLYKKVGNKNWVDLCDEEMTKEVLIWIDIWWIKRRKEIRYDIDKDLVDTYLEKTMQPLQLLQLLQPYVIYTTTSSLTKENNNSVSFTWLQTQITFVIILDMYCFKKVFGCGLKFALQISYNFSLLTTSSLYIQKSIAHLMVFCSYVSSRQYR